MAKKIDTSNLTVDYKQLMRMTVQDRVGMAKSGFGEELMQSLTPTQLALAFPKYYARQLPDIGRIITGGGGGGSAPSYGGAGTSSGGGAGTSSGGGSTATPAPAAPSGRQNPQPSSNAKENKSNAFLDALRKAQEKLTNQQPNFAPITGQQYTSDQTLKPEEFYGVSAWSELGNVVTGGGKSFNPGNLKFSGSKFQQEAFGRYSAGGQLTQSNQKDEGTPQIQFANPVAGSAGATRLAMQYYKDNKKTLRQYIGSYTPGYKEAAGHIAKIMGIGVDDDLNLKDPESMIKFQKALYTQEVGPDTYNKMGGDKMTRQGVMTAYKNSYETLFKEKLPESVTNHFGKDPTGNSPGLRKEGNTSSSYDTWPKPLRDYLDNNPDAKREALAKASTGVNVVDIFNTVYAKNPKIFENNPEKTADVVRTITNTPPGEIPNIPEGEFRERVIESQANATRRYPLNKKVKDSINYALHQAEKNLPSGSRLEFNVISGGQDKEGQKKLDSSNRHNHGLAGDGDVYIIDKDNKKRQLRSNSADDRAIVASISRHFSEVMPGAGIGGFSPDTTYMGVGGNRIHIGGPNQPGGPSTTWHASAETEAAVAQGTKIQNKNIKDKRYPLEEWKKKREAAAAAAAAVAAPVAATQVPETLTQQNKAPVPAGAVAVPTAQELEARNPSGKRKQGAGLDPLRVGIDPAPAPGTTAPVADRSLATPAATVAAPAPVPGATGIPAAPATPAAATATPAAPAAPTAVPAAPTAAPAAPTQMAYGDAGRLPPTGKEPIQLSSNGKVLADVSPGEMIKAPKANGSGKGEVVPERRIDDIRTEVQNDPRNMEQQEQPQQSNQPMAAMTSSPQQQPQQNMNNDQKYAELMNSTYDKPGSMDSAYRMSRLQSNPTRGNLDVGNTGHNTLT